MPRHSTGKRSAPTTPRMSTRASKVAKTDAGDVTTTQSSSKAKKGKKALPPSTFKSSALPLHIHITHTPPTAEVPSSAEPPLSMDVGHIASITMLPAEFGTGSYGWKGSKRALVELVGGGGGEKVQVMFTFNAVVVGSKDAEEEGAEEGEPAVNGNGTEVEKAEAAVDKEDADEKEAAEALAPEA